MITLPPGAVDLSDVMSITTPTLITGAGVGNTTLRGACGAGGIAVVSGGGVTLTLTLANLTLSGVALDASGTGTELVLLGAAVSWAGCGCTGTPVARVGAGAALSVVASHVCASPGAACARGSCNVEVAGDGAVSQVNGEVWESCARVYAEESSRSARRRPRRAPPQHAHRASARRPLARLYFVFVFVFVSAAPPPVSCARVTRMRASCVGYVSRGRRPREPRTRARWSADADTPRRVRCPTRRADRHRGGAVVPRPLREAAVPGRAPVSRVVVARQPRRHGTARAR